MQRWAPALALTGLAAITLAWPAPTRAHAELVAAEPRPNASLVDAPSEVRITFSEPIDVSSVGIEVLDARLQPIDGGRISLTDADRTAVRSLPALEPGVYTVSYQVVSTVDGHATAGRFAFGIDPSGTDAPPTVEATSTSPSVDALAIAFRWLALAAALVSLGTLTTWWQAGRPVLAAMAPTVDRRPPWPWLLATCLGTFVGLAVYLSLAARPLGDLAVGRAGLPLDFAAPFGWTAFAIAMRVALAGSLLATTIAVGTLVLRRRGSERARGVAAVAVAACMALTLAGMSAAGHASSLGGPIAATIDWAHLVAAAAWLGGLPAIFILARRTSEAGPATRSVAASMLRRHGAVALAAGPLVVVTGLANSPLVLGSSRELVAGGYGNLLLVKAGLASLALGIGAVNHLALRTRRSAFPSLLVGAEVVIGAFAVMAAATLVTIQPGAARQPVLAGASVNPAHLYGEAGPSSIHASVSLPAPGEQSYQVTVADARSGGPHLDVQKVFLTFSPPPVAGLPSERVELQAGQFDGLYGVRGAYTPVVGEWGIDVTVRREGARDESSSFEITVMEPVPPRPGPPPDTGVGVPWPVAATWSLLPSGVAGWLPGAVAALGVLLLPLAARRIRTPWLTPLRIGLVVVAAIAILGAGSRSVVDAANTPSATELATYQQGEVTGNAARGEPIYAANCASCHGTDGSGDGSVETVPRPRDLAQTVSPLSDAELSYRIANGRAGTPMPAFAAVLTEQERWDLIAYLRERWGGE